MQSIRIIALFAAMFAVVVGVKWFQADAKCARAGRVLADIQMGSERYARASEILKNVNTIEARYMRVRALFNDALTGRKPIGRRREMLQRAESELERLQGVAPGYRDVREFVNHFAMVKRRVKF